MSLRSFQAKSEAVARDNLSLAPPPLRDALAGLSAPSVNGLDIPPALLLSPLAARLREDVGANRHDLLAMPIHKMLAMARFQGWSASHIGEYAGRKEGRGSTTRGCASTVGKGIPLVVDRGRLLRERICRRRA